MGRCSNEKSGIVTGAGQTEECDLNCSFMLRTRYAMRVRRRGHGNDREDVGRVKIHSADVMYFEVHFPERTS